MGNPQNDAMYLTFTSAQNDGTTVWPALASLNKAGASGAGPPLVISWLSFSGMLLRMSVLDQRRTHRQALSDF
jgi:hypothetical protein